MAARRPLRARNDVGAQEGAGELRQAAWGQPRGLVLRGRHGTPFNIHVHQGKEVFYPARLENAERAQGLQTFDAEPAHCWMWTNKTTEAVKVKIELQRQAR